MHASGGMVYALEAGGGAWCLLGALTKGKLGLLRIIGRRAHAVADVLLAVALGLSPFAVRHGLDWVAVALAEAVVLVQLRLAAWTDYHGRHAAALRAARAGSGPAHAGPAPPAGAPGGERVLKAVRVAGRSAGAARRGATSAGAKVGPAVDGVANRLGRAAGAARRAGARSRQSRPPAG